ncbi:hypothetical protein J4466_02890 [Candidatus Pacearchaeota archaeon]|nr:hypothetical protein [Candidatus Pacearchaeota archaeon]
MPRDNEVKLIAKLLLERLANMDKWGGAHSELKRVAKSLPLYIRETAKGKKQINQAVKLLLNQRFLLMKPSTGEWHVSLNPSMKKEIMDFIEENDKEDYKI